MIYQLVETYSASMANPKRATAMRGAIQWTCAYAPVQANMNIAIGRMPFRIRGSGRIRRQEGIVIRSPKHHRKEPCLEVVPVRRRAFVHHFLRGDRAEGTDDAYHDAHECCPRDAQAEMADPNAIGKAKKRSRGARIRMTDLHELVGLAHFNTKVARHIQTVIKIMIGSVKSIMNGLNSTITTTSLNGFFSSSSIVRYIGSPVSFLNFAAFFLSKTGARVPGMKRVKRLNRNVAPTKMNGIQ